MCSFIILFNENKGLKTYKSSQYDLNIRPLCQQMYPTKGIPHIYTKKKLKGIPYVILTKV